jgi:hypothetical protein
LYSKEVNLFYKGAGRQQSKVPLFQAAVDKHTCLECLPIYLGENVLKDVVSLQGQPAKGEKGNHNHKHIDDLWTKDEKATFSSATYFVQLW